MTKLRAICLTFIRWREARAWAAFKRWQRAGWWAHGIAKPIEKPTETKRAEGQEKPSVVQRATMDEKPKAHERAVSVEKSTDYQRSDRRSLPEQPATTEVTVD